MLEIDRETGEPTLLKLVAVDDAGNLINPLIVEGQIHGGLAQGIGQAMIEEVVYNDDGQLLTGSFMDYAMPRAIDFPRFELAQHGDADAGESARRQGRRRSRHARLDAVHRQRGGRRAERVRREAHRHDAAAREAVAHHPGRPGVIPTTFDYDARHVARRCAGEAAAANGGGEAHRRRPQPRAADEAAAERAAACSSTSRASRASPASARRTARSRSAPRPCTTTSRRPPLLQQQCPVVAEAAATIGDPQVRNRGTLGGSLAHADPSADYPAVMLALDAEIHIKGPSGWRVGEGAATSSRICSRSIWRRTRSSSACSSRRCKRAAYAKLHQRASHFAIVGVAAALDVNDGTIQSARIGLTGASSHAHAADRTSSRRSRGSRCRRQTIEAAAQVAGADLTDVNSDIHASADYRRAMIPVFTRRALDGRAGARVGKASGPRAQASGLGKASGTVPLDSPEP